MRGIILAAGKGGRLNGTARRARSASSRSAACRSSSVRCASCAGCGIDDIVIVVGCQAERVRRACGHRITYVENTQYSQTNSLYSLWMARPLLFGGFVVLNCDVLFHPVLLSDLLTARHEDALLLAYREANQPSFGDEEMKVTVRKGRVVSMSKQMDPAEADGENLGIVKFGPRGAAALVDIMDRVIASGSLRDWAPRAFSEFAQERSLHAIGTRGYPWIEIDFPEDYRRAVNEILPQIESSSTTELELDDDASSRLPLAAGDFR